MLVSIICTACRLSLAHKCPKHFQHITNIIYSTIEFQYHEAYSMNFEIYISSFMMAVTWCQTEYQRLNQWVIVETKWNYFDRLASRVPATAALMNCLHERKKFIIFSSLFVHLWSTHFAIVCNVCKQKRTLRSDYWISFFSFFNEIIKIKLIKMSASNRMAKLLYCSTLLPSLDRYFESIEEIHSLCSDFCQ